MPLLLSFHFLEHSPCRGRMELQISYVLSAEASLLKSQSSSITSRREFPTQGGNSVSFFPHFLLPVSASIEDDVQKATMYEPKYQVVITHSSIF